MMIEEIRTILAVLAPLKRRPIHIRRTVSPLDGAESLR